MITAQPLQYQALTSTYPITPQGMDAFYQVFTIGSGSLANYKCTLKHERLLPSFAQPKGKNKPTTAAYKYNART